MYKILVVDDEQTERDGICFLLHKFRYPFQIVTQNNGRAGLSYLQTNRVDVICSDIKMPFMDGLAFCDEARKLYPEVKLVLLSAYYDFEYAKKAIKTKVDDYILKPVVVEEFRDMMDQIVMDLDEISKRRQNWKVLFSRYTLFEDSLKKKLLKEFVAESWFSGTQEDIPVLSEKRLVNRVLEIIDREYTTNLTIGDIAERVNFSRGHLSAVFKNETGLSCMQYIAIMRMHKAQQLLLQSDMKISDVAKSVGYNDISYFGLTFKKAFGMTPAQFRNAGRRADEDEA